MILTDAEKLIASDVGTYDVSDLAELLKCSERHIRNMAESGDIPGMFRLGRLVRFHREFVSAWLSEKAKGADRG